MIGPGSYLLAWNRPWEQLVTPLGMFDDPPPNLARYVFRHPRARATFPDWSTVADEQVRRLRAAEPQWSDAPAFGALLDELLSVPEFAVRWPAHDVAQRHRGNNRLLHPDLGELSIGYEVLDLPDDGGQRLIAWLPADNATATAIGTAPTGAAAAGPPQLRVVGEP